jgi:hypothetical protein
MERLPALSLKVRAEWKKGGCSNSWAPRQTGLFGSRSSPFGFGDEPATIRSAITLFRLDVAAPGFLSLLMIP